jgi:hypothetical protein
MNTIGYSRPFALWQRHERDEALVVARVSASATSDSCCRNASTRGPVAPGRRVELARDLDELGEVLEPALGLDRALGLQRLEVAVSCRTASSRSPTGRAGRRARAARSIVA